eukprot:1248802-Prymnesium_polylepis.1
MRPPAARGRGLRVLKGAASFRRFKHKSETISITKNGGIGFLVGFEKKRGPMSFPRSQVRIPIRGDERDFLTFFLEAAITYDHTTHRKAARRQLFREARRHCSCPDYAMPSSFCLGPRS